MTQCDVNKVQMVEKIRFMDLFCASFENMRNWYPFRYHKTIFYRRNCVTLPTAQIV